MYWKYICGLSALALTLNGAAAYADTSFVFTLNSGNYPAITATTPDSFELEVDNYYHSPVVTQQIGNDATRSEILFTDTAVDFASKDADVTVTTPLFDGTAFLAGTYAALFYNDYPTRISGIPEGSGLAGTLVITNTTPEPSSLLLLGTGMVGVMAAARRRWSGAL